MRGRYEIKDTDNPADRGMRFSTLAAAQRELDHAVPSGRFVVYDRERGEVVATD